MINFKNLLPIVMNNINSIDNIHDIDNINDKDHIGSISNVKNANILLM